MIRRNASPPFLVVTRITGPQFVEGDVGVNRDHHRGMESKMKNFERLWWRVGKEPWKE